MVSGVCQKHLGAENKVIEILSPADLSPRRVQVDVRQTYYSYILSHP